MHEEHEGPEMTSTPAWSSEEFSLAPAPTYESPFAAEPAPLVAEEPVVEPAVVEPAVDPAELLAAQAHIVDLQAQLTRVEEENRAFMQSLRHVAAAAEELLAEARVEAASLREGVERDLAQAHAELDARRESFVRDAQRDADRLLMESRAEAHGLLEESRATAHELVVVARADAREAVHEERRRAADDLEMLAALRERIADERNTLSQFHTQLSGRLRFLMHSMLEFADQNPALDLGDSSFAATVLTGPHPGRSIALSAAADAPATDRAPAVSPSATRPEGDMHGDEAHLDRAFDAFFSNDIDEDPSRRWILED